MHLQIFMADACAQIHPVTLIFILVVPCFRWLNNQLNFVSYVHIKMQSFFSYLVLTYLSSYCWGGVTVSPMMSTYDCFTYLYSGTYISYFMLFTGRGNNNSITGRKQILAFNNGCFINNICSVSYITVGEHLLVCTCVCPIPVKGYGYEYRYHCVMLWCEGSTTWNTLV
jgi:hypothetical protein